ncbi:MAG: argininosuccinate synthase, partial [Actinomycetota bacterium]
VVLAYSGGLDTSVTARTLREEDGYEVIAALVDLGQPLDLPAIRARADAAAVELHVIDAREAFAERHCLPALHANALYEGKYPLVSALARPLIAEEVVRVARDRGASAVAHGCTGKGNDQVRFEASFAALAPELRALAPVRESSFSRDEALARARGWGIPIASESSVYSVDENLWGRTVECGPLEDPWTEPPSDAFDLTADPLDAPNHPAEVVLAFERGSPVALDGERMSPVDLIARLNALAGGHGVGRVDMIENRLVGIKSRELYEVPGALALISAHRDLEDLTLERDLAHQKAALEARWAELCYTGLWHGPLHAGLRSFMAASQERVTGEVRLRLHKGRCEVTGRRSPLALYDHSLATYDRAADRFDHGDAAGFVRLWSLPLRVWSEGTPDGAEVGPRTPTPTVDAPPTPGPDVPSAPARPSAPEPRVWSARMGGTPDPVAVAFTASDADRRLIVYDLRCAAAHARALGRAGLLADDDVARLTAEVDALTDEARTGAFPFREDDEDVHVAVERVLTERLGDLGARIHAGRSRNDLVAADLRLWVKEASARVVEATRELAEALADRAEDHAETAMPGYTHLQR